MESNSKPGLSSEIVKVTRIVVNKELHSLLETVKKMQLVPTYEEVLEGLRIYIWEKKLIDPVNPLKICCKGDKLGSVFGTEEFTLYDLKNILSKLVCPADYLNKNSGGAPLHSVADSFSKRKNCELEESEAKKVCTKNLPPGSVSPMILHIPPSPTFGNSSDSSESFQGYETAFVKDTSDDLLSLGDDGDYVTGEEGILAIEETFNLEYEVESDSSDDYSSRSGSEDSDSDCIAEVALDTAILAFVARADSDIEFFADNSSEEDGDYDVEMSELDHWTCITCNSLNKPPMRYCLKCWNQRLEWLPEKSRQMERRPPPKKKRKSKAVKCDTYKEHEANVTFTSRDSQGSSSDVLSNSAEIKEAPSTSNDVCPVNSFDTEAKLCIICCSKPPNASIIHGKFAHQISCYKCARKLQKLKKRCPVCRRTIEKVVYQISNF